MSIKSYVEYQVRAGFGLITLDNAPVNALSPALIEECLHAIEKAASDKDIRAFIFVGRNGKFSGGADITAFKDALKPGAKNLRHLIESIEKSDKPFIAAIDGIALGGGLELALACDFRCSTKAAKLGLPEIKLGLLPGAGGTQRLPRLIGQQAALEIILSGEPIAADKALALGVVDELICADASADSPSNSSVEPDGEFLAAALEFANRKLEQASKRRVSSLKVEAKPEVIAASRVKVPSIDLGGLAHHRAIDCVEMTSKFSFIDGMAAERRHFEKLFQSSQAQSRIHLFFAERSASKIPGLSSDIKPAPVKSAAVIGAGTMGGGIAVNFLNADIPITIIDTTQELVDRSKKTIEALFAAVVKKGRMSQSEADRRLGHLKTATTYDGLKDVDIVIEAVFENMKIKQEVFRNLSDVCREDAILATNTSTLDVEQIANVVKNPARVIGMHFFSPANIMKLLEVVRGAQTSDVAIATALAVGKTMKKVAVLVGNCDGFVGNRMLNGYVREAEILLEEGALPDQIDRVMTEFGFAMGPFAVGDLAGIDVHARIRMERKERGAVTFRDSNISTLLFEQGRYGQKTSAGWYRYEPGSRKPLVDEAVNTVIIEESKRLGITRAQIEDDEIIKRCLYPMINEGARILEEGIAIRSSDIDIIWIYGYGFPAFRGGPMFWADTIGLSEILADLKTFQAKYGDVWKPAPLLEKLAENKQTFADFKGAQLCAKP